MRPSTTAASAVQTELLQGPVAQSSQASTDLGREAARQLREQNNPNTRYIDKPDATSNKNLLRAAQGRQQAAMGSVRRQALGEGVGANLKPSGTFPAPSVPQPQRPQMQLVSKGGAVRLAPVPAIGANLAAAGAAIAIEQAAQPALKYLGEKLARGLYSGYEAIFGDQDGVTFDEMQTIFAQVKQDVEMQRQQGNFTARDEIEDRVESLRKQLSDMSGLPYIPTITPEPDSPLAQFSRSQLRSIQDAPTVDEKAELIRRFKEQNHRAQLTKPAPLPEQPIVEATEAADVQSDPPIDPRNREYQIRRAALGDNPTKEEIAAVVAYGLEQHRINFPHLYEPKTPNPLMS